MSVSVYALYECMYVRVCMSVCAHMCTHAVSFKMLNVLQKAREELRNREADLLQQGECQGWVAVDSGEHHHLTEQSDLNGLLHLCQSLQDHLKY